MNISTNTLQENKDVNEDVFEDSTLFENFVSSTFIDATIQDDNLANNNGDKSALNVSALCCDEELFGYDKLTGQNWIYPTNYPVRDYQFNIIKSALIKNTLVSLPTGLGKTFIAAVVMYNFFRWYPLGKIVFTAPTRPLVAQQIEACYNIVAIPPKDTIEMTGHMSVVTRKTHWQSKRVFFATPQVIYNDIKSGICPGDKMRCLVIDEAHRARGNYAYCQIISTLNDIGHTKYRVLALSATPGSKVEDVINVVNNLHIAHLELRTENCIDVAPYSHSRRINTVVIQLGRELTQLRNQYVEIIDGYTRRLKQFNILPQNLGNLSKGRVVMLYKEFQNRERSLRHPHHNFIMKDFTVLIALYHGLELLTKHGSRVFLNFFDEHPEKTWIQADDRLTMILERLRDDLGVNPLSLDRSVLPDGTIPEIPKDLSFGHPKFYKLKEIMLEHFTSAKRKGEDTRAIVFCEYRESVNLVHCLLLQCRPLIVPQMFVGQGSSGREGGVSQRAQARAVRAFRSGAVNALVSTCVGEEGLDVGEVDLCVCFDVSTRSPVRLVQRCGRTGRARGGHVYILVTEGREHQTLMDSMRQRDGLNSKILHSKEVQNSLYKMNPRMLPHDFTPECRKMYITVKPVERENSQEKAKKGQKDLRSMLQGRPSTSNSRDLPNRDVISREEFDKLYPDGYLNMERLAEPTEYWPMSRERIREMSTAKEPKTNLSTWLEWQRTAQHTVNVGHSTDTDMLADILQYCDSRRFETLPATQTQRTDVIHQIQPTQNVNPTTPVKNKPNNKRKQKLPLVKTPNKKDGDIRALFSTATKSTKNYTKLINDLGIQKNDNLSTQLISLLVDLSLENTNTTKKCYICLNLCNCKIIQDIRSVNKTNNVMLPLQNELNLPDINLIDDFDANLLMTYNYCELESNVNTKAKDMDYNQNFNLELDFDSISSSPITNSAPKKEIIKEENVIAQEEIVKHEIVNVDKNFDIGDIDDIFAASSPEDCSDQNIVKQEVNFTKPVEALGFFGLDSIDDIFADSDDEPCEAKQKELRTTLNDNLKPISNTTTATLEFNNDTKRDVNKEIEANKVVPPILSPKSPSLLSGRYMKSPSASTSPILCSQVRKFQLSTKKKSCNSTPTGNIKRNLSLFFDGNKTSPSTSKMPTSFVDKDRSNDKSMLTITQLVEMINEKNEHSVSKISNVSNAVGNNRPTCTDQRSPSPILLTQRDRMKTSNIIDHKPKLCPSQASRSENLIILDSDSDSNEGTQVYDLNDSRIKHDNKNTSLVKENNVNNKRKFDDSNISSSPYFIKKPKISNSENKPLSLQEKVLAALNFNKDDPDFDPKTRDSTTNFMIRSPILCSQKENRNPLTNIFNNKIVDIDEKRSQNTKLEMLQMFKRSKNTPNRITNSYPTANKLLFNSSDDDDFVNDNKTQRSPKRSMETCSDRIANYKKRKKKKLAAQFIEEEAELSDGGSRSGDELSDESVGSIIDFICDEPPAADAVDMHAYYMRSVKSPVKGVFKIPELPKTFNSNEILSQFVEDDTYVMDSFCVDSHIGLTQVNDVSELEIAEKILEEKKKRRRKETNAKVHKAELNESCDSPVIRRKFKNVIMKIESDSESD